MPKIFKIEVYTPCSHSDIIRQAIGEAGGGTLGNYTYCSFSTKGIGRFKGNKNAHPYSGKAHHYEVVEEEKIEVQVTEENLRSVLTAIKKVHPYEEVALHIIPLFRPEKF
jgi:hypothetical protein